MIERIKFLWWYLTHKHEWVYAGHDDDPKLGTLGIKESFWYWHLEKCELCDDTRNVMNDEHHDDCGYYTS